MHVPDGFLDAPTSIATGVVAAAAVTVALRKVRNEHEEKAAPLAGLTAAFIFAVQMLTFPVGVGTSGHLLGGALAAVLVGPWTAILCMSVVLLVQGLLFADGGLTALGTNITLMGVIAVLVGWGVVRVVLGLPRWSRPRSSPPWYRCRRPRSRSSRSTRSVARPTCRSVRWPPPWSAGTP